MREFVGTRRKSHFLSQDGFSFQQEHQQPLQTLCLLDLLGRNKHITIRTDETPTLFFLPN